jgi:hypothetical protein
MEKFVPASVPQHANGEPAVMAKDEPTLILASKPVSNAMLPFRIAQSHPAVSRLRVMNDPEILGQLLEGLLNLP